MTYTITPNLLSNIEKGETIYFTDILFPFTQRNNPIKVAKDKKGEVIKEYQKISKNADIIKTWLELMSFNPSPFEKIEVDIGNIKCIETKFIELCSKTIGSNNLIVYSSQLIKKFNCEENKINYNDRIINVLDRDFARQELNPKSTVQNTIISNSQIAQGNSQISDSENK